MLVAYNRFIRVLSFQVMFDDVGKSKGFGFVSFDDTESAERVSFV